jgi:mannose PTS system EIIA component
LDQFTNCDGILCLVDIPGGSPARVVAAQSFKRKGVEIISGVSLPMLIEALFAREDQSLKELAQTAVQAGVDGVLDLGARLHET